MSIPMILINAAHALSGLGAVIVSAWGGGGAGGNVHTSGDGEDAGPGGNGAFVEFKIEGLKGTETIYAYPGGGGSISVPGEIKGNAGGGGAATVVYITDGTNTDYLCVVGGGGGGGGVGSDPDDNDATAGGEGGAAGGSGATAENVGLGADGGGGGTQSAGGSGPGNGDAGTGPGAGDYAGDGGDGGDGSAGSSGAGGAGGVIGHAFGGAGGAGGEHSGGEGGGGGGGGGYYGGGGGEGDDGGNDAGAGGGGGSTNLNTSPSGFSYLTITQVSTSAGTASPTVQHDGTASTQAAGSTNEFSISPAGQGGDGGKTNGDTGFSGSNGRVVAGFEGSSVLGLNTVNTSGSSKLVSALDEADYSTPPVTSNLVVHLDAGVSGSYPGSGSTWYDLSGQSNDFTLTNSPTYSSDNGGKFQFNGSNQGASGGPNLSNDDCTVVSIQRYASNNNSARGRITAGKGNNWLMGMHSNRTAVYYAGGWIRDVTGTDTDWHIHAVTEDDGADNRVLYDNNVAPSGQTASGGNHGPNGFSLGWYENGNGEYSDCEVAALLVYDRVLSTTELTSIYNFYKGRFGLS